MEYCPADVDINPILDVGHTDRIASAATNIYSYEALDTGWNHPRNIRPSPIGDHQPDMGTSARDSPSLMDFLRAAGGAVLTYWNYRKRQVTVEKRKA